MEPRPLALLTNPDDPVDAEGVRPSTFAPLPPDNPGATRATLDAMARLTKVYRATPTIRAQAEAIVAGVPEKNYFGELTAVQAWVRDAVRYTRDVYDVETLKTPIETLRTLQGDCDDKALLAGTLLQALGFKIRYVAVATVEPGVFDHVYLEALLGNSNWVPIETTEPVNPGWAAPAVSPPMIAHV